MKKRVFLPVLAVLFLAAVLTLASCSKDPPKLNRVGLPFTPETREISLSALAAAGDLSPFGDVSGILASCAVHEGVLYYTTCTQYGRSTPEFASVTDPMIFSADLETGEEAVFAPDILADSLCADADALIVLCEAWTAVEELSYEDGSVIARYPLPFAAQWGIACGDGILLAASRDEIVMIRRSDGKQTRFNLTGLDFICVDEIAVADRNHIYVSLLTDFSSDMASVVLFDRWGGRVKIWPEAVKTGLFWHDGALWSSDPVSGELIRTLPGKTPEVVQVFPVKPSQSAFVTGSAGQNLPSEFLYHSTSGFLLAVDENAALMFRSDANTLTLHPRRNPDDMLRILCDKNDADRLRTASGLAGAENCKFEQVSRGAFLHDLRVRLFLGGEDFDLAYVNPKDSSYMGGEDFLSLIVKEGFYTDLCSSPALSENLSAMFPALLSRVTLPDGAVVCLPDSYSVTAADKNPAFPALADKPLFRWTEEDFLSVFDKMAEEDPDRRLICLGPTGSQSDLETCLFKFLENAVGAEPDGRENAEETAARLLGFFREQYVARLLSGKETNALYTASVTGEPWAAAYGTGFSFGSWLPSRSDEGEAAPQAEERTPIGITISGFWIVNPDSPRKDQALAFLARLTSEENRYNLRVLPAPLFPGFDRYGFDPAYGPGPIPPDRREEILALEERFAEFFDTPSGGLYLSVSAREALDRYLFNISVSPEETAEKLFGESVFSGQK